jgi:hypothetical protein
LVLVGGGGLELLLGGGLLLLLGGGLLLLLGGGLLVGLVGGADELVSGMVTVVMPCGPLVVVTINRRVVVGEVVVVDVDVGVVLSEVGSFVVVVCEVPTVCPV